MAGVPYDGWLTKADGKGLWWEGLDPQDLYCGPKAAIPKNIVTAEALRKWCDGQMKWSQAPPNDPAYITKWFNRVKDLIDQHNPDLIYFDDSQAPMGEAGLNIFAHYYNANIQRHNGKLDGVVNTKGMPKELLKTLVHDFERGRSNAIEPYPWQTDTCIGEWHYKREIYEKHAYKTPQAVDPHVGGHRQQERQPAVERSRPRRWDHRRGRGEVPRGHGRLDGRQQRVHLRHAAVADLRRGPGANQERPVQRRRRRTLHRRRTSASPPRATRFMPSPWPGRASRRWSNRWPRARRSSPARWPRSGSWAAIRTSNFATEQGLTVKMPKGKPCAHAFALKITGLKTIPPPSHLGGSQ